MRRGWILFVVGTAAALAGHHPLAAQAGPDEEVELLRQASLQEAAGELAQAEALLLRVLETRGASVPALLSLERVLRIQGRVEDLTPPARRALDEDPSSSLLNQLVVRTYSALDSVVEMEQAAAAWIARVPEVETPYREVAQLWAERGDYERARIVLEEGRLRIDREDALALELGDLYTRLSRPDLAAREWDRAIGPEAAGLAQVRRRLRALPDGGAGVLPGLVDRLAAEPASAARLRAAVDLAMDGGLGPRARSLAERVLPRLPPAERHELVIDVARRADGAHLTELAHWAYARLVELEDQEGRLLAIRNRLAELALELGDTAAASAEFQAVEAAYREGTPQRRQAAALRIELLAGQDVGRAVEALREFRHDYPEATETDRLAAAVAGGLLADERSDAARLLLAGVRGPLSAQLRGRLALQRGDVEAARLEYMSAAPALRGGSATGVLALVTLLGRISGDGARALGEAMRWQDRGQPGEALDGLVAAVPGLPVDDRAPVLEYAAVLADQAGLMEDARRIRGALLDEYPHSTEAPAALLELARSLLRESGGAGQARELLERLIIEHPRSALVPQARRELDRLGRRELGAGRGME